MMIESRHGGALGAEPASLAFQQQGGESVRAILPSSIIGDGELGLKKLGLCGCGSGPIFRPPGGADLEPPQGGMTLPVTLPIAVKKHPVSPYSTQSCALGIYLINQVFAAT